ncbi:MAG: nuclear transport factor 2 family protein [Parvularculaceae bacterium]
MLKPVLAPIIAVSMMACACARDRIDPVRAESELKMITQEMLDAIAPGRVDVWEKFLDDGLIHVDETGAVRTKAELIAELAPLPPGLDGNLKVDAFRMRLHGDIAVVAHEDQEYLNYHGQELHSRFRSLDTWRRTPEGWRLIAQQTAAVLKDPPPIQLPREALCAYAGRYRLTDAIETTIACAEKSLISKREGRPDAIYLAETADMFFAPGAPRTRRYFQRNATGAVTGFADRREGEDILWRRE